MMKTTGSHTVYHMEIADQQDSFYNINIKSGKRKCMLAFNPEKKELKFTQDNSLTKELITNSYQIRKILNNKRPDTFYPGFKLKFILKHNPDVIAFNDLSRIIVLDRRDGEYKVSSAIMEEKSIYQIYTDGCYLGKIKKGAWVALFKKPDGKLNISYGKTDLSSSSLIELVAVIEGLKILNHVNELRIISDSRYVIKGLTEWVFNWKLNNWHTAQGEKVKNIEFWQEFDSLTENKYIEFRWVKGHSEQPENSLCDYYAKILARK